MKSVAILQSNYIPWKGYFDLIAAVDEFIIYDDMQYTRRDWRNRNKIKTPAGLQWLTVPVKTKGKFDQRISDTEIDGDSWAADHWQSIALNYRRSPHFSTIASLLEPHYSQRHYTHLSDLNRSLIVAICDFLGITTTIRNCQEYVLIEGKSDRLADLCRQADAGEYISGPAARAYIDEQSFTERGIRLRWFDYTGYAEYPQLWGSFVHEVSIIDLLFNCGVDAFRHLKYVRP